MKNQKQKEYETPQTTFVEVELEGNFCASADVQNPNDEKTGQIESHKVNTDFDFDFADQTWDQQ
ncbi:hypothetical protein [uncultured Bacteroides sp.]|uniref:hypothetical protein n=1 Tax=uncultured Bacteroides sp. TaxID=162156 RepID=UPI00280B2B6B|nr:hypothetical protein [uncultured Bacteroides sp.]